MADSSEYGVVYEATITGDGSATNVSFDATSSDEINSAVWAVMESGSLVSAINQADITGSNGTFTVECPFDGCVWWKLYLWKKNTVLSDSSISWTSGNSIPVEAIINSINLMQQRFSTEITNIARALRVPEQGSDYLLLPPASERAGKILGFDSVGNPTIGDDCSMISVLADQKAILDALVTTAEAKIETQVNSAKTLVAQQAGAATTEAVSTLQTFVANQQEELKQAADKASLSKEELRRVALDAAKSAREAKNAARVDEIDELKSRMGALETAVRNLIAAIQVETLKNE